MDRRNYKLYFNEFDSLSDQSNEEERSASPWHQRSESMQGADGDYLFDEDIGRALGDSRVPDSNPRSHVDGNDRPWSCATATSNPSDFAESRSVWSRNSAVGADKSVELTVFYHNHSNHNRGNHCNQNDRVEDIDEDCLRPKKASIDSGYPAEPYESELTDMEDWRQFARADPPKLLPRLLESIVENKKAVLLLAALSVIAVGLLIALITIVNRS